MTTYNFVSLDFETTGFSPINDEIVEVGMVKFYIDENMEPHVISTIEELIRPQGSFDLTKTSKITGITVEDIKNGRPPRGVLKELRNEIDGHIVIAHNASFDANFLYASLRKLGLYIPNCVVWDSLEVAKYYAIRVLNNKLTTLKKHYKLEKCGDSHRALSDAIDVMNLMSVFFKSHGYELVESAAKPAHIKKLPLFHCKKVGEEVKEFLKTKEFVSVKGNDGTGLRRMIVRPILAHKKKEEGYILVREKGGPRRSISMKTLEIEGE